jgi:hypothetical protein
MNNITKVEQCFRIQNEHEEKLRNSAEANFWGNDNDYQEETSRQLKPHG